MIIILDEESKNHLNEVASMWRDYFTKGEAVEKEVKGERVDNQEKEFLDFVFDRDFIEGECIVINKGELLEKKDD